MRSLDDDDDPAICTRCGCTRDAPRATEHTNSVAANSTYITGIGTCPEKVWLSLNQGRIVTFCFSQAVDSIERLQCYSMYLPLREGITITDPQIHDRHVDVMVNVTDPLYGDHYIYCSVNKSVSKLVKLLIHTGQLIEEYQLCGCVCVGVCIRVFSVCLVCV